MDDTESSKSGEDTLENPMALAETAPGRSGEEHDVELRALRANARAALFGPDSSKPVEIGRYQIQRKLGEGGMGAVFLARDPELDRDVALKLLRTSSTVSEAAHSRMVREAKSMARLSHPNVAHVYEVGRFEDQTYVAMEYIAGRTLRQWQKEKEPTPAEIVAMHVRAARGLQAAHEAGLVHRDYKPENVLVGDDDRPRVLDFGLAQVVDRPQETLDALAASARNDAETDLTLTGTVMGTPAYMAPEQFDGATTDARTDQFAACVMLYEALWGQRPFAGKTYETLALAVRHGELSAPPAAESPMLRDLRVAITRGLNTDASRRFGSIAELIEALDNALEVQPPKAHSRAPILAIGLTTLIGGLALVGVLSSNRSPPPEPPPEPPTQVDRWAEILAGSNLPEPLPTPLPDDPFGVSVHRLKNGLTIYVAPRSDEPRIHAQAFVRAGAMYEPPGSEGIAHLMEHALFKGTPTIGTTDWEAERPLLEKRDTLTRQLAATTDDAAREEILAELRQVIGEAAKFQIATEYFTLMEELGATDVNGQTSYESISTVADIPSNRLEAWAELEADRLRHPTFRLFFPEFSTVANEFQGRVGAASVVMELETTLFDGTGRRSIPVSGTPEVLARPPLEQMRALHEKRFCPNNTAIVLVGDIDPTRAVAIIERFFGDWEPKPLDAPPPPASPLPPGRIDKEVHGSSPLNLAIAWRRPGRTAEEVDVLSALGDLLAQMIRERSPDLPGKIPLQAWASETLFSMVGNTAGPENTQSADEAVLDALRAVANHDIPPELLERARNEADARLRRLARSRVWTGLVIGSSYSHGQAWSRDVSSLDIERKFDPAGLAAAAGHLLEQGRIVITLDGKPAPVPKIDLPIVEVDPRTEGHSPRAQSILETPATRLDPQVLLAGRHFYQRQRDGAWTISAPTDDGLFSLVLRFPHDSYADPMGELAARAWASVFQDADPWNRLGLDVQVDGSLTIEISGPAKYASKVVDAIPEWFASGTVDEPFVERARSASVTGADLIGGEAVAELAKEFALLGSRSWWLHEPTAAEIEHVEIARLERIRSDLASMRPHIAYTGPNAKEFDLQLDGETRPRPERPRAVSPEEPRVLVVDSPMGGRAKVGLLRIGEGPAEPVLRDLLSAYIGEMPGVLHHELREKRGLAYWIIVQSWAPVPDGRTRFQVLVDVNPDNVPAVVNLIDTALAKPIDPARFDRTRTSVEESYRARRVLPFEVAQTVLDWRLDGIETDPRIEDWGRLPAVTLEEFETFYRAINDRPATWIIVGDPAELDIEALSHLGTVERLEPSDLRR